jgi:hypothetical protein
MAGGFAHHERLASQTSPRVTGRSLDPQPRPQLGLVRGEGGMAPDTARMEGDVHAERPYGALTQTNDPRPKVTTRTTIGMRPIAPRHACLAR